MSIIQNSLCLALSVAALVPLGCGPSSWIHADGWRLEPLRSLSTVVVAKDNPEVIWAFGDDLTPDFWPSPPPYAPGEWCLYLNLETDAAIFIKLPFGSRYSYVLQVRNLKWERLDGDINGSGVADISLLVPLEDGTFSNRRPHSKTPIKFHLDEPLTQDSRPPQARMVPKPSRGKMNI